MAQKQQECHALQALDSVPIWDILDQDPRPTFVLDLDPDVIHTAVDVPALFPSFENSALVTHEALCDAVRGIRGDDRENQPAEATQYASFCAWATSRTVYDDSGDVFPVTYCFHDMLWTGSTINKRWRLVSGNALQTASNTDATSNMCLGSEHERGLINDNLTSDSISHERKPHRRSRNVVDESSSKFERAMPQRPLTKSPDPKTSSYSSLTQSSATLLNLDVDHLAHDWTANHPKGTLSDHIQFARSIDWAATPLGPLRHWSPEFKQIANLLMKTPQPAAIFWGSDLTVMYNEAYKDHVAGHKHPNLMGTGLQGPFSEIWDVLADIFAECARTGDSVSMENQMLPIWRYGFLEETYFTWSLTPVYGSGSKILGFYNLPIETTQQCVNQRRTETLFDLGHHTALARTVTEFWQQLLAGLKGNLFDVPVALIYSVVNYDDGESSSASGGSISLKSCVLEGSLGVPEGHIAAPTRLDLKRSIEGFVPSFREAMRTREPTKLSVQDGTLPESLIEGVEWRGFNEPCREAIVFPIRPTNGENVMAFLLIGVNPRRPYDSSYRLFVDMLSRQLATSLASVLLFEDEVQRGEAAIQAVAKERENLSQQLEEQILRMQRMTEISPVGMYYLNARGALLEANDRYFEMTGFIRHDTQEMSFMKTVHPECLHLAHEAWRCYTVEHVSWAGELRLNQPWVDPANGEELENWIIATGQPEFDQLGEVKSILGSITDISRIKWAETLQNRRLQDAEESRRQMNNFLDLTSHEMRNPLSAIIHCADAIHDGLQEAINHDSGFIHAVHECREAAETIALCAQHQKSIVDDILTVSKLDSDLLVLVPTVVQPTNIVRQVMKMFELEMQKDAIQWECVVDSSLDDLKIDSVLLDHNRLLQILINLVTNAIKFTRGKAERAISVRICASNAPPTMDDVRDFEYVVLKNENSDVINTEGFGLGELLCLSFQVRDSGCGLTEDEKKRLFIRFSQATPRTHATYGGSGLGLFISRQLTELHGGQIGVGSQPGTGSVFAFYILCRRVTSVATQPQTMRSEIPKIRCSSRDETPETQSLSRPAPVLVESSDSQKKLSKLPVRDQGPSLNFGDLWVLIVEDNLINQKILSKQLTKLGCTVAVADHGADALVHIKNSCFWTKRDSRLKSDVAPLSIVLMDIEMPVMDGLTCVTRIRELQRDGHITGHIPIIAVTANVREELVTLAKTSGMDDVVLKPFRIPQLTLKMSEVLTKYAVMKAS